MKIPDGLPEGSAAAVPSAHATAWYGLHNLARIQAGDYPDILNDNAFAGSADADLLYPIDEVMSAETIAAICAMVAERLAPLGFGLGLDEIGDAFGLASGFFYGASMFFNGYRKDADTTARGVWNFIFAVLGAGLITIILNSLGSQPGMENWALSVHFTTFNWIGAVLLWIICGPIALGFLLVAGRNLPAADYGTIAYWEVPVAIFVGLVVFGEALTVNRVPVTVLFGDSRQVAVSGALKQGDGVVVRGAGSLQDGDKVELFRG